MNWFGEDYDSIDDAGVKNSVVVIPMLEGKEDV